MAGYPNEMRDFITANPMDSRIIDYRNKWLYSKWITWNLYIFCEERGYTYNDEVLK